MPDKRKHRGAHPEDAKLFAADQLNAIRMAVADYSQLLSKDYAPKSALKLVGDHFLLTQRQRLAVMRSACSDTQLAVRIEKQVDVSTLSNQPLVIDGYNLLITLESAMSGAPIFIGRDGCCRDLSGIHGSYRKVSETIPALQLAAKSLADLNVVDTLWLFDSPVSNSGKLKTMITQLATEHSWPWRVQLLTNPDTELIASPRTVATSDSNILDNCTRWTNLTAHNIRRYTDGDNTVNIIDLSSPPNAS